MAQEKSFEEKLKQWLASEGIYALGTPAQDMTVEPCGFWNKRWGGSKYVKAGLPDMQIVVKGISIEVELKAPNGRLSELQKQKINQIDECGGIGIVLFPKDFEKFKQLVLLFKDVSPKWKYALVHLDLESGWKNA